MNKMEIPEFTPAPKSIRCETRGCTKAIYRDSKKCLDCQVDEALPALYAELDNIFERD